MLKLEEMAQWYPSLVRELGLETTVATGWHRLTHHECFYRLPGQNCSATNRTLLLGATATADPTRVEEIRKVAHNKNAHDHMEEHYTPELIRFVSNYARSDMDLFGYPQTPWHLGRGAAA